MSKSFKRFIDTEGKTLAEIRKTAENLAKNLIPPELDEAELALQKEIRSKIQEVASEAKKKSEEIPAPKILREQEYYSNIERAAPNKLTPDEIAYPHESIPDNLTPRETALTEKIFEMRKKRQETYVGYITSRCIDVTFVMQGEFMSDVTDDYPRIAFCGMAMPMYAAMSNSQLRTYFTWRTDARRGVYRKIDKPYVLLYVYELLNKIGVISSADAFGKLLDLWNGASFAKYLDELMPRWLKDFYAFNDITASYPDITGLMKSSAKSDSEKSAGEILEKNYKNKLKYLAENSAYDIKKSVFFSKENKPLLEGAAEGVLTALDEYFSFENIDLGTLLCGQLKKDYSWTPFNGALVNLDRADGFHAVTISASERYCVRRGEPALECFAFFPQKGFIGYILKSIEARLRANTGYARKITPNKNMLLNDFKNREKLLNAVLDKRFSDTIQSAVDEYCRKNGISAKKSSAKAAKTENADYVQYAKKDIEIDISKLDAIRAKADETAQKLIVEDFPDEDFVERASERISNEEFDEKITEYQKLSEEPGLDLPENLPKEWENFAKSLTLVQLELLRILSKGEKPDAFCRENNYLPEAIFEEINSKSMETILDIVIENSEIIPDYLSAVRIIINRLS